MPSGTGSCIRDARLAANERVRRPFTTVSYHRHRRAAAMSASIALAAARPSRTQRRAAGPQPDMDDPAGDRQAGAPKDEHRIPVGGPTTRRGSTPTPSPSRRPGGTLSGLGRCPTPSGRRELETRRWAGPALLASRSCTGGSSRSRRCSGWARAQPSRSGRRRRSSAGVRTPGTVRSCNGWSTHPRPARAQASRTAGRSVGLPVRRRSSYTRKW